MYNMTFSADLDSIVGGSVHAIPANQAKQAKDLQFGVSLGGIFFCKRFL